MLNKYKQLLHSLSTSFFSAIQFTLLKNTVDLHVLTELCNHYLILQYFYCPNRDPNPLAVTPLHILFFASSPSLNLSNSLITLWTHVKIAPILYLHYLRFFFLSIYPTIMTIKRWKCLFFKYPPNDSVFSDKYKGHV